MGQKKKGPFQHRSSGNAVTIVGLLALLLLTYGLQACSLTPVRLRAILPAEKADWVLVTPDGRWVLFVEERKSLKLLDLATGRETFVSESSIATWLDDGLLVGDNYAAPQVRYFVVNLEPFVVINLTRLPGDSLDLVQYIREADSIYALKTGTDKYLLLLLQRDLSGTVTQGCYIEGVRNLDTVLAGIPYKTTTSSGLHCPLDRKVFSPDGLYYYIHGSELRIYSWQGELLNSISGKYLHCYGWAWDSSGVFIQERNAGLGGSIIGPLQLLLASP